MIYFFHHYELPVIIQQAQVQQILRLRTRQRHNQQTGNATNNASSPDASANQRATNSDNAGPTNRNDAANETQTSASNASNTSNNQINANSSNNNNNNVANNNISANNVDGRRNIVVHIGNLLTQHSFVNRAINVVGAVRNVIANDVIGAGGIFNNNNNSTNTNLNNNNRLGNRTQRIHINFTNLRRINLSGIEINPTESEANANDDENRRQPSATTATSDSNVETGVTETTDAIDRNESVASVQFAPHAIDVNDQSHDEKATFDKVIVPSSTNVEITEINDVDEFTIERRSQTENSRPSNDLVDFDTCSDSIDVSDTDTYASIVATRDAADATNDQMPIDARNDFSTDNSSVEHSLHTIRCSGKGDTNVSARISHTTDCSCDDEFAGNRLSFATLNSDEVTQIETSKMQNDSNQTKNDHSNCSLINLNEIENVLPAESHAATSAETQIVTQRTKENEQETKTKSSTN